MKIFAYYLPQYYPTKINNENWFPGFTEWHNVANAKKLFPGHIQPQLPGLLGFYDLRLRDTRKKQGEIAKDYGIDGFAIWHYWSNGKRLLSKPLELMIEDGYPNIPFFLSWANHDWHKKTWDSNTSWVSNKCIFKQVYPDEEDIRKHFNYCLKYFKHQNYFLIDNKPVFSIYSANEVTYFDKMRAIWNKLALENNFNGVHFIAQIRNKDLLNSKNILNCEMINLSNHRELFNKRNFTSKVISKLRRLSTNRPNILDYKKAIRLMEDNLWQSEKIIPTIIPNWDHTPRSGINGNVLTNVSPELFLKHLNSIKKNIQTKKNQLVFLKSWNEWGEGNFIEPSKNNGFKYLEQIHKIKND